MKVGVEWFWRRQLCFIVSRISYFTEIFCTFVSCVGYFMGGIRSLVYVETWFLSKMLVSSSTPFIRFWTLVSSWGAGYATCHSFILLLLCLVRALSCWRLFMCTRGQGPSNSADLHISVCVERVLLRSGNIICTRQGHGFIFLPTTVGVLQVSSSLSEENHRPWSGVNVWLQKKGPACSCYVVNNYFLILC